MHKDFDRDLSTGSVSMKWLRGAGVAAAVAMSLAASVPAAAQSAMGTTSAHGAPPASTQAPAQSGGARQPAAQAGGAGGDPFAAPVTTGPMNPYAPRPTLAPVQKTIIQNQAAYERLMNNSGITVQWLWHANRGHLQATDTNDVVRLEGTQSNYEGTLKMKGEVVAISTDRFRFRGTILIVDAPDKGRNCERTGDFDFRISGKRKYWRLQQMEFCGGLTDYVDVYF
ncbi:MULTISPECIES: hypothetical protein [unclassified Achromobacter]|uniref:hypothetical protein n=1 Tax=unclassified Achromobacter TaxID=2626865 RepID=UPI001E2E58E1|nr:MULTISPECIES: hypothetical protein [unclassified Achromobacter]